MAFDQNITYRVNIDDANFQAKLSQMRASMDQTMGGGMGGGFGGGMASYAAMMGPTSGGYTGGMMNGMDAFGAGIRPITYTPPAIAMQPHFGMIALQQTTGQAFMGAMGPAGVALQGGSRSFRHPFTAQNVIPDNISAAEYMSLSARSFGTKAGDAASTAAYVATDVAGSLVGGTIGAAVGNMILPGIGGIVGGLVGSQAPEVLMGPVGTMMKNNRAVQTQLEKGSFRFITGGGDTDALTGRGFSRQARASVADFVQTSELHDTRMNMNDMKDIMQGGMENNLFAGTGDVESFKKKFTDLVSNVKTVAATLHTSLKEAYNMMGEMQQMGVMPAQAGAFAVRSEAYGRMSGMTGSEMVAVGQAGASIFQGTGIRMSLGAEANQQNRAMVTQMLNQGTLSRETINQAGGENALAQQMTATGLAGTQTAIGRGILMANFNAATGTLNPNMASDMAKGGLVGMLSRAAGQSPQAIMSFQARQEEVVSQMNPMQMQLFGMQGGMMEASMVTGAISSGFKKGTPQYQRALEDNFINARKRQGVAIAEIQTEVAMLHSDPEKMKEAGQASVNSMGTQAAMEDLRNKYSFKGMVTNKIGGIVQAIQRPFTALSTAVGTAIDNTALRLMGGNVVDSKFVDQKTLSEARSAAEGRAAARSSNPLVAAPVNQNGDVTDLRGAWGQASGQDTAAAMSTMGANVMKFKSEADIKAYAQRTHQDMSIIANKNGEILAVSKEEENKAYKRRSDVLPTSQDKEAAAKFKTSGTMDDAMQAIAAREAGGGKASSVQEISAILNKDKGFGKLSAAAQGEVIARYSKGMGLKGAGDQMDKVRGDAMSKAAEKHSAADIQKATEYGKDIRDKFSRIERSQGGAGGKAAAAEIDKLPLDASNELALVISDPTNPKRSAMITDLEFNHGVTAATIQESIKTVGSELKNRGGLEDVKKKSAEAQGALASSSDTMVAAGTAVGANGVGSIGKDTQKSMNDMSNQLIENMKMLIALQKQFNEGSKK